MLNKGYCIKNGDQQTSDLAEIKVCAASEDLKLLSTSDFTRLEVGIRCQQCRRVREDALYDLGLLSGGRADRCLPHLHHLRRLVR